MELPNLMPYQELPFNGDTFIEKEFLKLRDKFNVDVIVETGTCLGSTTMFLTEKFSRCITIESSQEFRDLAIARFKENAFTDSRYPVTMLGDSAKVLPEIFRTDIFLFKERTPMFFLDAHWEEACPLLDELNAIAEAKILPVIAIHDFFVPNSKLGFDLTHGKAFDIEFIRPMLDKIYGKGYFDYYYNNDEESTDVKRGIIYIYPNRDAIGNFMKKEPNAIRSGSKQDKLPSGPTYTEVMDSMNKSEESKPDDISPAAVVNDPASTPVEKVSNDVALYKSGVQPAVYLGKSHEQKVKAWSEITPTISLFINYYIDKNEVRRKEIDDTVMDNIANPDISLVYLVVETDKDVDLSVYDKFLTSDKVSVIPWMSRPTYANFFDIMNHLQRNHMEIMILSNADVYMTASVTALLNTHMKTPLCFALSHWDKLADGSYRHERIDLVTGNLTGKSDQQDVWVFKGRIKPIKNADFTLGRPGCDNCIALCIQQAGYHVVNPSNDIRPVHNHISEVRNYDTTKVGEGVNPERINQEHLILPPVGINMIPFVAETPGVPVVDVHDTIAPEHRGETALPVKSWIDDIPTAGAGESQFHEDAIIEHIFKHIGSPTRFFVDLGAGAYTGKMSNTRKLKNEGWVGYGVDKTETEDNWVIKDFIKPETIVAILMMQATPPGFDFLNLDIDSSDFWVLKNILEAGYRPRLICSEFNGTLDPNVSKVLQYENGYTWDETNKYGYSFAAGKKLLELHGYVIIHNLLNVNIFAVRKDLLQDVKDIKPVTATLDPYHPANPNAVWVDY